MTYVRCINNQTYVRMSGEPVNGALAVLTIGAVYKVLPTSPHERATGMIRIIDNSGADYLYAAHYFEPFDRGTLACEGGAEHTALTMHIDPHTKAILRAEAFATHQSMGALVRQWMAERLALHTE